MFRSTVKHGGCHDSDSSTMRESAGEGWLVGAFASFVTGPPAPRSAPPRRVVAGAAFGRQMFFDQLFAVNPVFENVMWVL